MSKILGIDYGSKRSGIAISDSLQIIGSPLESLHTKDLENRIEELIDIEGIIGIVIGMPRGLRTHKTDNSQPVVKFAKSLRKRFPRVKIWFEDERYTSKLAMRAMVEGNLPKSKRSDKFTVNKISASIILQSFLNRSRDRKENSH